MQTLPSCSRIKLEKHLLESYGIFIVNKISVIASIVVLPFFVISHVRLTCFQVKIHHGCTSTLRSRQCTPSSALQTHSRQRTPNAYQAAHTKRTPVMHSQRTPVMHLQRTPTSFKYLHPHSRHTPGSALPATHSQCTPDSALQTHSMQCTRNALQWCTHNALHPN